MSLTRARADNRSVLVVVPNVGGATDGQRLFLDVKAVEGLAQYARLWPGAVRCLVRGAPVETIGYGRWYSPDALPFETRILAPDAGTAALASQAGDAAVVLAGADNHHDLGLVEALPNVPVVMTIEYTLRTRLDIVRLERGPLPRSLKTTIWLLVSERQRRSALRRAAGLQANGAPAYAAYASLNRRPLLYFDTRLRDRAALGEAAMTEKAGRIASGTPLRLVYSGRLERMKGVDDLIAVMTALHRRKSTARLDIYGAGSRRRALQDAIHRAALEDFVAIHDPIDFDTELVPMLQKDCDIFLCCHRRPTPRAPIWRHLGAACRFWDMRTQRLRGSSILAHAACKCRWARRSSWRTRSYISTTIVRRWLH